MSSTSEVISGSGIPTPLGPYSQAVRAGDLLFVSGQAGIDPSTGKAAGPSFGESASRPSATSMPFWKPPDLVVNTTVLLADFAVFAAGGVLP